MSELLSRERREAASGPVIETWIRPSPWWRPVDVVEAWRYRDLLWLLIRRDISVRYRQTMLGAGWALAQPLAALLIYGTLFGLLRAKPVEEGVPYALSAFAGLCIWQFFFTSLSQATDSLVMNQNVISKVYFPRVFLPLAPFGTALLDCCIAAVVLVGLMVWYAQPPQLSWVLAPLFIALAGLTSFALGLWVSAITASYRDLRQIVPFALHAMFLVSPVLYDSDSVVPERWQSLYFLNPMAGIIEGFRWSLLGSSGVDPVGMTISLTMVALIGVSGLFYFRSTERTMSDWL